ncbi:MAG: AAA family ATPase [Burkholderiaceae bacterium]|nr:AAA family ATPase [Burkholderiaceae bacterium]MDH5207034.1 AAA family ATPase [Burkholderiaceae bacterium]
MDSLDTCPNPSAIVRHLDEYVIGQDAAKRTLAVAVYAHYRKLALAREDGLEITKSNVLLVGPTGTGKTLLCESLARLLSVPFVTADATSLAQSRYVNDEIQAILERLHDKAAGDVERTQRGIVFIDEVDKLKSASLSADHGTSGESVQHALLKIMEGAPVRLSGGQYLDTSHVLFICGGAFVGLEEIMSASHGFGFVATSAADDRRILESLNERVKPDDLVKFGLIPEFTGRLAIVARLRDLSRDMLVRIMTEPRNCIYRQFRAILKAHHVDLVVEPRVFEEIADLALEYKSGARSLRGLFEELLAPVLFAVPDHPEVRRVELASIFSEPRYFRANA